MNENKFQPEGKVVTFKPRTSKSKKVTPPLNPTTLSELNIEQLLSAEGRREALRLEAAVNLAVGITLQRAGLTEIRISPEQLFEFQSNNQVTQEVHEDGSFTIKVSSK